MPIRSRTLLSPMPPRDPREPHRAATTLELLFDLVTVIAISAAAAGLHHAIAEGHLSTGILRFSAAFFAIWWAWMNYTWFASAYDNDDVAFRLLTAVLMAGSLVMAAGVSLVFAALDLTLVIVGYVIMRLGLVALWLRAASSDPRRRSTALTYAGGIALVQLFWAGLLFLPPLSPQVFPLLFAVGAGLELAVPVLAERKDVTPWHRHHITERYGLLNIIVLGETLLAATVSLRTAYAGPYDIAYVHIAISALAIVISLWWLYFAGEDHLTADSLDRALIWGYGHVVIFAAGAAVGAGFAVLVEIVAGHAAVPIIVGDFAVAVPVAFYLLGLWFVRDRFCLEGTGRFVLPVFAGLVLLAAPFALELVAAATVLAVVARAYPARRDPRA